MKTNKIVMIKTKIAEQDTSEKKKQNKRTKEKKYLDDIDNVFVYYGHVHMHHIIFNFRSNTKNERNNL